MADLNIPITQKLLVTAGGWPAMKQAQQLHAAGRVAEAAYNPPLLSGLVREGNRTLRSGLRIKSEKDVENICTCRESREWGRICPHALAVGLAFMQRPAKPHEEVVAAPQEKRGPKFVEIGAQPAPVIAFHFILPPKLEAAWARGEIMLVAEVQLPGGRAMPSALSPNETYACDSADLAALDTLPELSAMRMLARDEFLRVLRGLRGHPRVTLGKSTRLEISADTYRPRLFVALNGDVLHLRVDEHLLMAGDDAWVMHGNCLKPLPEGVPAELKDLECGELRFSGERAQQFLAFQAPRLGEWFRVETPPGFALPRVEKIAPKIVLMIEGSLRELRAEMRLRFPELASEPGVVQLRDENAERAPVKRLQDLGFGKSGDRFVLRDENRIARFFAFEYPRLKEEWEITLSPQAAKTSSELEPLQPRVDIVSSGENWFELTYSLGTTSGERFSAAELQRLLRSGQTKTRLRNGRVAVFDTEAIRDFEEVLRDVDPQQRQPGVYRIDRVHADYVGATTGVATLLSPKPDSGQECPLSGLRDYQREGVAWLSRLAQRNLGGILADEMGLGKTVQTLAFLQAQRANEPALIVCPTSLLTNWQNETQRWAPELRLLVLEGPERHARFADIAAHNLVLTSYALLQRDIDKYKPLQFSTVVLDEAQHIKNPETQNAQAAFALRARNRFVLTGTPVENSVRDLWSLMNFAVRGYLGSRADFRERYEQPLARGDAPDVQRRLARRMRPFLLRRTKREVAKELPEKIEQRVVCDLTPAQRAAYDGLLREIQTGLTSERGNDGALRIKMLLGLLRLRQVCCDLRLLGSAGVSPAVSRGSRDTAADTAGRSSIERAGALPRGASTGGRGARAPQCAEAEERSAKLELLDELLEEAIDGGHRVLLFSQFVSMLGLIRERLDAKSIPFAYLDGSTKERQAVVDRFQSDTSIPVFLMSLKAGGVGLNLSAADIVIHFDPWWNYAAEAQATDRAHRIGQTRVVTAYKLIARDTVEEKIVKLQERKRSASEALVASEEPLMSGLTTEDLEELLR